MYRLHDALQKPPVSADTKFWEYCFPGLDFNAERPAANLPPKVKAELFRRVTEALSGSQKKHAKFWHA